MLCNVVFSSVAGPGEQEQRQGDGGIRGQLAISASNWRFHLGFSIKTV